MDHPKLESSQGGSNLEQSNWASMNVNRRSKHLPRNIELSISFFRSSRRRCVFSSMIAKDFLFSFVNFRRNRIFSRVWILETLSITFSVSSAYDCFKMSTCSEISFKINAHQNQYSVWRRNSFSARFVNPPTHYNRWPICDAFYVICFQSSPWVWNDLRA